MKAIHRSLPLVLLAAAGLHGCGSAPVPTAAWPSCANKAQIACVSDWLERRGGPDGSPTSDPGAGTVDSAPLAESGSLIEVSVRVVGGEDLDNFPAIGGINMRVNGEFKPHCTGTLIGRFTVLTAAHCLVGYKGLDMEFVTSPDATAPPPETRFEVIRRLPHTAYKPGAGWANDIALLYLDPKKPPPDWITRLPVAPTALATKVLAQGQPLLFVGYGYMKNVNGYKMGLGRKRAVTMPTVPSTPPSTTTFSYKVAGKNTCKGDSGGPALWPERGNPAPFIVGVTSLTDEACSRIGVDTRADAYVADWLSKNIDVLPPG